MRKYKKYKLYFRLRGNTKYEIMECEKEGLNSDDARRKTRDELGDDFYVLKAKLIR